MLRVKAGNHHLITKHVKREPDCYPDKGAKSNYVNTVENRLIVHNTKVEIPTFKIMPRVVTNGLYCEFVKAAKYQPVDTVNYLEHWNGFVCPDSLRDKPVVNVNLDDARAYAGWAGMRLPTEWEWQVAAEEHGDKFTFNEVFEWNESERFDGHNYFVTLRGGCKDWVTKTSRWYFPGAIPPKNAGGPQPLDSHSIYFLMKNRL